MLEDDDGCASAPIVLDSTCKKKERLFSSLKDIFIFRRCCQDDLQWLCWSTVLKCFSFLLDQLRLKMKVDKETLQRKSLYGCVCVYNRVCVWVCVFDPGGNNPFLRLHLCKGSLTLKPHPSWASSLSPEHCRSHLLLQAGHSLRKTPSGMMGDFSGVLLAQPWWIFNLAQHSGYLLNFLSFPLLLSSNCFRE